MSTSSIEPRVVYVGACCVTFGDPPRRQAAYAVCWGVESEHNFAVPLQGKRQTAVRAHMEGLAVALEKAAKLHPLERVIVRTSYQYAISEAARLQSARRFEKCTMNRANDDIWWRFERELAIRKLPVTFERIVSAAGDRTAKYASLLAKRAAVDASGN